MSDLQIYRLHIKTRILSTSHPTLTRISMFSDETKIVVNFISQGVMVAGPILETVSGWITSDLTRHKIVHKVPPWYFLLTVSRHGTSQGLPIHQECLRLG